jgi:hypothetical protein
MSLLEYALGSTDKLPKAISPRLHGYLDYAQAAALIGLGFAFRKRNRRASAAAFTTGAFMLTQALLTDYPLGAQPVLPFAMHGRIDAAFASTAWLVPKIFGFADTEAAEVFAGHAAVVAAITSLTDFSTERAKIERAGF